MKVDPEKCIGCNRCSWYCTMDAIRLTRDVRGKVVAQIDLDECVECGVCLRSDVCLSGAIYQQELEWPRVLRSAFSDPLAKHESTGLPGRGTEEMKTNDVTGRFKCGYAGLALEVGRPSVGTRLRDVQTITRAMAAMGVDFEPANPLTALITNLATGDMREDVLDEKVLSAIVEFIIPLERLPAFLNRIREVSEQIDSVFSLDLISKVYDDGSVPTVRLAEECGYEVQPNAKTCVGLGRPLYTFDSREGYYG